MPILTDIFNQQGIFYAPELSMWGHIVLLVSVCLSAENLTFEINIFQ